MTTSLREFRLSRDFFFFFLEIGIGLSGFGTFFLLLGMLLLFDKGLLAIGNVRNVIFLEIIIIAFFYILNSHLKDSIHFGFVSNNWPREDGEVLFWQAKSQRICIFLWWRFHCFIWLAVDWHASWNLRFHSVVRVIVFEILIGV